MFNEGYASTAGPNLLSFDLSDKAIRLTRLLHAGFRYDRGVIGLLALMLLTDARRPARTDINVKAAEVDARCQDSDRMVTA